MLLMSDRRTIYINIAFFAVLIFGYLFVTFYWNSPGGPAQVLSFESAGLDRPLAPLSKNRKSQSLKDYRGAPILLHFWASWCEPCRRDEKPLREIYSAAGGRGAQFVMVASEDRPEAIQRAGKLESYPGDTYLDSSGDLARALSVKGYPATLLIDKAGRVVFRSEGPLVEEDVGRLKEELTRSTAVPIPSFAYQDSNGREFSSKSLEDKIWLASFIFTSCGGTCPMISEKLRELQGEFGTNPDFRIVSFSVDPERDSPARLKDFGKQHGADPAIWAFLRPPAGSLTELMVKGFRLGTAADPLLHTAKIVVVGKGNVVKSYIDGDERTAVPKLQAELRSALRESTRTANRD